MNIFNLVQSKQFPHLGILNNETGKIAVFESPEMCKAAFDELKVNEDFFNQFILNDVGPEWKKIIDNTNRM